MSTDPRSHIRALALTSIFHWAGWCGSDVFSDRIRCLGRRELRRCVLAGAPVLSGFVVSGVRFQVINKRR